MKKLLLTLVFASVISNLNAQTETEKNSKNIFNKWSIEFAAGFNTVQKPLTPGYWTATPGLFVADLGARYMFNNKFGLKADFGYNNFESKDDSKDFQSKYYRFDVQGVANLGRIMNFETWTKTIGLLGHTGFGLSYLENTDASIDDKMINYIAGVTGQIKLSEKFALTGDFSTIIHAKQYFNFDGYGLNPAPRGFSGIVFNTTVGLTYYLGKNSNHADWQIDNQKELEIEALKQQIGKIETSLLDTDRDGVTDYIDLEPNTISGVTVDTKGRSIDLNKNGVPDELESYFEKTYGKSSDQSSDPKYNESIKKLINNGYITVYFDSNSSVPTNFSTDNINFILTYLRNNPTASIDIVGHADELGKSEYNNKLSKARAEAVKSILVKANINASRLNIIAAGEDNSVVKDSESARKLVRSVTFIIK
ncbi:OmpA family protein [Flavobacterium maritimum]|uniref:OmpA family protein n=1 Tax=Flavobacterium maritimum TaxID=3149042 RepID=UPI0032B3DD07